MSESFRQAFIVAPFVQRAHPNLSIASFSAQPQQHRMPAFVPAFVAVRKRLLTWRRGVEPRTQFPAPWLSSPKGPLLATEVVLRNWLSDWAWVSVNCDAYSYNTSGRRQVRSRKHDECFSPSNSYMRLKCP